MKSNTKWRLFLFSFFVLCCGTTMNAYSQTPVSKKIILQDFLFEKPATPFPVEGKFIYKSATELSQMIRTHKATSVEITTEFINHIKNNNYKYNAIIYLREEEALAEAKAIDEAIARGQVNDKPLLGVPVTIKENWWVKGSPSTLNAKMYPLVAARDAAMVTKIKNSGAVVLGTTNVPYMLGSFQTQGEIYPTASNPFDTTRTPGGSTGGGAAAQAAGFSTISLGGDLGGSIRVPSAFCGLWSLKPTYGSVESLDGSRPDTSYIPQRLYLVSAGPLARTPNDLQLMWNVIKNQDTHIATNKKIKDYRFAWMDEWTIGSEKIEISGEMKEQLASFIALLNKQKASTEKNAPDMYLDLVKLFLRSFGYILGEKKPVFVRKYIANQFYPSDDSTNLMYNLKKAVLDVADEGWEGTQQDRKTLTAKWEEFFKQYDFFVSPVSYGPAFKKCKPDEPIKTDDGKTMREFNYVPYAYIINATGHPAITVPAGYNKQGLPIGIQIVGKYNSDEELLHLAKLLEPLVAKFKKPSTL